MANTNKYSYTNNHFFFGAHSRYKAAEVNTRFGRAWAVTDAETVDEVTGSPALVDHFTTREALDDFVEATEAAEKIGVSSCR